MKHVKRPCDACPYRKDSEPGRFDPERWEALRASGADARGMGPEYGAVLFACHKTPEGAERACAGWLATEGGNHPGVRLAIVVGDLPACVLSPAEAWPELHATLLEAMEHDLDGREPFVLPDLRTVSPRDAKPVYGGTDPASDPDATEEKP